MSDDSYTAQDVIGIERGLGLGVKDRSRLRNCLKQLETKGSVLKLKQSRYALREMKPAKEEPPITGRIRQLRGGKTLFIPSTSCEDYLRKRLKRDEPRLEFLVNPLRRMSAMDGDRVRVRVKLVTASNYRRHHKGRPSLNEMKVEVSVEEILERRNQQWVGTLGVNKRFGYVKGDGITSPDHILLTEAPDAAALVGMSVVVEPQSYPKGKMEATGRIIEVLGWPEDEGVDMQVIIKRHNLHDSFPPEVIAESKQFTDVIPAEEYAKRDDWRQKCVVTIDPETARDFDDAISVRRLKKGWELAVHIADASYFVRPGSALDKEAEIRGNSTYLPDRVLPMLPPVLCDNLCSLKEGVDRLTLLCLMQINEAGHVSSFEIKRSVIKSSKRMVYDEVLQLIEKGTSTGDKTIDTMLREAYILSSLMRKERFAHGSLDLDMPSLQVILDDKGAPVDIQIEESDDAHRLIEEFMLAANECVACTLREKMLPALYRVHETPDMSRLHEFSNLVKQYGIKCGLLNSYEELNWVVEQIKDLPDASMLKVSLLRSLMRARYSPQPLGHFGLAKGDYCHFTSPIRRYADLIVHRSLHRMCGDKARLLRPHFLNDVAEHVSETERISATAENESKKLKLLQYLEKQCDLPIELRRPWSAFVSAAIPRGVAIDVPELQLKGLIAIDDLSQKGRWYFEGHAQRWSSTHGESYRVSDKIKVIIARIDIENQFVDFLPAAQQDDATSVERQSTPKRTARPAHPKAVNKLNVTAKSKGENKAKPNVKVTRKGKR